MRCPDSSFLPVVTTTFFALGVTPGNYIILHYVFHFWPLLVSAESLICWFLPRFSLPVSLLCEPWSTNSSIQVASVLFILLYCQFFFFLCHYILYLNIVSRLFFSWITHHTPMMTFVSLIFTPSMIKLVHSNCDVNGPQFMSSVFRTTRRPEV